VFSRSDGVLTYRLDVVQMLLHFFLSGSLLALPFPGRIVFSPSMLPAHAHYNSRYAHSGLYADRELK